VSICSSLASHSQDIDQHSSFYFYTGEAHSLKVEKILFQGKSPYQEVLVFEVTLEQLRLL
jgi:spermidine synthase